MRGDGGDSAVGAAGGAAAGVGRSDGEAEGRTDQNAGWRDRNERAAIRLSPQTTVAIGTAQKPPAQPRRGTGDLDSVTDAAGCENLGRLLLASARASASTATTATAAVGELVGSVTLDPWWGGLGSAAPVQQPVSSTASRPGPETDQRTPASFDLALVCQRWRQSDAQSSRPTAIRGGGWPESCTLFSAPADGGTSRAPIARCQVIICVRRGG